jgi:hypothetical protein
MTTQAVTRFPPAAIRDAGHGSFRERLAVARDRPRR